MIGQFSGDVVGRLSVKPCILLAVKTRNVIGAFLSVYCHSLTVVYCQSNCPLSTAMCWESKNKQGNSETIQNGDSKQKHKIKYFKPV